MNIIQKKSIFKDNIQYAEIMINNGKYIGIKTHDLNNNYTGYMNIYFHPNNRLYLDTIYCYDQFRKSGIATTINELVEYFLKGYVGYVIRGVFKPGQLSTDRDNNIKRSEEELVNSAKKFYQSIDYQIIGYYEFNCNKSKYYFLNDEDFYLGEDGYSTIVAKQLKIKNHPFYEENGVIYKNNEMFNDIKILKKK